MVNDQQFRITSNTRSNFSDPNGRLIYQLIELLGARRAYAIAITSCDSEIDKAYLKQLYLHVDQQIKQLLNLES